MHSHVLNLTLTSNLCFWESFCASDASAQHLVFRESKDDSFEEIFADNKLHHTPQPTNTYAVATANIQPCAAKQVPQQCGHL